MARFLTQFEAGLGDPATLEMNTARLDGATASLEQVFSTAGALPFLASRRLVILTHPLARARDKAGQKKLTDLLEKTPPTTALVLIHSELLEAGKNKSHWLLSWAEAHEALIQVRAFPLPKGAELGKRVQILAKEQGGQISGEAADLLATLVDGDLRLAAQEIPKLLAYVNYKRPIEADDVQALTADVSEGDIFALVDALSAKDNRRSLELLERLLEYQEYYGIFGMIVRQFRLLILAREALERNSSLPETMAALQTGSRFVAEKMLGQARRFSLPELELSYRRLLAIDEAVKTSQTPDRLALETFVAGFTARPR